MAGPPHAHPSTHQCSYPATRPTCMVTKLSVSRVRSSNSAARGVSSSRGSSSSQRSATACASVRVCACVSMSTRTNKTVCVCACVRVYVFACFRGERESKGSCVCTVQCARVRARATHCRAVLSNESGACRQAPPNIQQTVLTKASLWPPLDSNSPPPPPLPPPPAACAAATDPHAAAAAAAGAEVAADPSASRGPGWGAGSARRQPVGRPGIWIDSGMGVRTASKDWVVSGRSGVC